MNNSALRVFIKLTALLQADQSELSSFNLYIIVR